MSRILIAEDDRGIADFIDRGLTAAGYTCDIAENGVDAFNLARTALLTSWSLIWACLRLMGLRCCGSFVLCRRYSQ